MHRRFAVAVAAVALLLPLAATPASAAGGPDAGKQAICEGTYYFKLMKRYRVQHRGLGVTQANTNTSYRYSSESEFTSEAEGQISAEVSGELGTTVRWLVAEVRASTKVAVRAQVTWRIANTLKVTTPPRHTSWARYGAYRLPTKAHTWYEYKSCKTGRHAYPRIKAPYRLGWVHGEEPI